MALSFGVACSSNGSGGSGTPTAAPTGTTPVAMTPVGTAGSGGDAPTPATPAANPASCNYDATLGAPPAAFVTSCAGCHGATGEGKGVYPSIRNVADTLTIVRMGRTSAKITLTTAEGHSIPAQMPAFSAAHLSDVDLGQIFAYLNAPLNPSPAAVPYCLSRPEASWTPAQIDEAYQRGLKAWRTAGTVDQNACVFCHGPDAMEFAFLGYSDAQIYRRAFTHVSQPIADDVIDMVHALRGRYKLEAPPDPAVARPFQPGGAVLPALRPRSATPPSAKS